MSTEIKCYCDRCGAEFKSEYIKAFKLSNSFSLSNPSKIISGDSIFDMILCHNCEEELLRWAKKENCLERINRKSEPCMVGSFWRYNK